MEPLVMHHARVWSARIAWLAGIVAMFVAVRVSFLWFSGAEGPGGCGTVPLRSLVTLWHTDDVCLRKATGWLNLGRVSGVMAIVAVAAWRMAYTRDMATE